MFLLKFSVFSIIINFCVSINIDLAFEGTSIKPPTVGLDHDFVTKPGLKWYMPMGSNYEIIRLAEIFLEKDINLLSEKEIANPCKMCILIPFGCNAFGKSSTFVTTPSEDGHTMDWSTPDGKIHGKFYITLTDNKTYFVKLNYWDNKHLGWSVASTTKTLDLSTRKKILDHVKSFGFDLNKVHETDYDKCSLKDEL